MRNETIAYLNEMLASDEVRHVESEAELSVVSALDASVYGGESINHEGLRGWWQTYKKGIYVLRKDDNIIGAIGIWPIKKSTFDKIIKGRIDEVDLKAKDISGRVRGRRNSYWYLADIVLEKKFRDTDEDLALFLMEETLRLWVSEGSLAPQIHVCALGFEDAGIKLLKNFDFQFAEGEPVTTRRGKPAYMRTMTVEELQKEINNLSAVRKKRAEERAKRAMKRTKILFLAANPTDTQRLNLQHEIEVIDQALRNSEYRDRFETAQHWEVSVDRLAEHLLRHDPDIVHFSGHGSEANEIILENKSGNSHAVSADELSKLFALLKDNIRCVVLNACYSEGQAQAIAAHIDCVVGMSEPIGDDSAIKFAASFYGALGFGKNVKTAFDLGCLQIDLENLGDEDVPKLICKESEAENTCFVPEIEKR